jgi:hypothetical protein
MVEGQPERNVLRSGSIWRTIAERLQLSEEPLGPLLSPASTASRPAVQ